MSHKVPMLTAAEMKAYTDKAMKEAQDTSGERFTFNPGDLVFVIKAPDRLAIWCEPTVRNTVGFITNGDICIVSGWSERAFTSAKKLEMVPVVTRVGTGWVVAECLTKCNPEPCVVE